MSALVFIKSIKLYSAAGNCFKAAACTTVSMRSRKSVIVDILFLDKVVAISITLIRRGYKQLSVLFQDIA